MLKAKIDGCQVVVVFGGGELGLPFAVGTKSQLKLELWVSPQ
jgi:hypothetical protein